MLISHPIKMISFLLFIFLPLLTAGNDCLAHYQNETLRVLKIFNEQRLNFDFVLDSIGSKLNITDLFRFPSFQYTISQCEAVDPATIRGKEIANAMLDEKNFHFVTGFHHFIWRLFDIKEVIGVKCPNEACQSIYCFELKED